MRSYPTMLQAIGKVFLKDLYSAIYRLGEDGNVWYVSRTARVNQGTVAEFREAIKGRTRFHPFTEDVESDFIRQENIIYNWR